MLTRDTILQSDDLPREELYVPQWEDTVYVSALTGAQREEFELAAQRQSDGDMTTLDLIALLATETLTDDKGEHLFTREDAPALKDKNAAALLLIGETALRVNALTNADLEDIQGE